MTLIPAKHNFTIWQGSTFYEVLTLYQSNDTSDPRDLTGYTMTMTINPKNTSLTNYSQIILSTNLSQTSVGCSITLANQTLYPGKMNVKILATSTDTTANGGLIDWKAAPYSLTMSQSGSVDTLLRGNIKVVGI